MPMMPIVRVLVAETAISPRDLASASAQPSISPSECTSGL